MTFFRAALVKDLRRYRRDPVSLLISIMVPLLIGILLKLIAGGNGGTPTARLLVADHDESILSGFLTGALSQGPLEDLVVTEQVEETKGRERMDRGEASGLLVIPEDFGDHVMTRTPTSLLLVKNPAQTILPGILEETLSSFAEVINSVNQILGPEGEALLDELANTDRPSDELVASVSVTINRLVQRAEPYLFPPAIEVETVYLEEAAENRTFAELFFPSMLFLAIIFAVQGASDDVWKERTRGTLRRTVGTPGSLAVFFLGKLAAGTVVIFLISLVALLLGRWALFIPLRNLPLAVIWATVSGLFMLLVFIVLQTLATSQRGGNMLTSAVLFPLVMIGGAFFPFEAMPDWMAAIGRLTPNGWALDRFKDVVGGTVEPPLILATLGGLALVGLLLFWISLRRLTVFARAS